MHEDGVTARLPNPIFINTAEKGPMEKAGKKADQAVEDVQTAVKKKTE
jgi:hypothetical protein